MKNFNELVKITELEEKVNLCMGLLEVAKTYCDTNYDKASEFPVLGTVLDLLLQNQREIVKNFDNIILE